MVAIDTPKTEEQLKEALLDPEQRKTLLENPENLAKFVADYSAERLKNGGLADMIKNGQQEGLLMSPQMWREYFKPGMAKLCKIVKDKNIFLFFHSCGNIECLIPELIEMGIDVLNPFQPEVMDVYRIKHEYGNRLCFYGGIGTQGVLPRGTVDQVKADVREKIRILGENGGYLLAPAHAVQTDVPIENILALVELMNNQ